jgi:hypothetical protein
LLHYIILQALDKADKLYIGCTVHSAAVITIAGKLSRPTYYPIPIDNGWLRFASVRFGSVLQRLKTLRPKSFHGRHSE